MPSGPVTYSATASASVLPLRGRSRRRARPFQPTSPSARREGERHRSDAVQVLLHRQARLVHAVGDVGAVVGVPWALLDEAYVRPEVWLRRWRMRISGAVPSAGSAEVRKEAGGRIVEAELAALDHRERRCGDHRLRQRRQPEDGVLAEPRAGLPVGESRGAGVGRSCRQVMRIHRTDDPPAGNAGVQRRVDGCRKAVSRLAIPREPSIGCSECHAAAAFGVAFLPRPATWLVRVCGVVGAVGCGGAAGAGDRRRRAAVVRADRQAGRPGGGQRLRLAHDPAADVAVLLRSVLPPVLRRPVRRRDQRECSARWAPASSSMPTA